MRGIRIVSKFIVKKYYNHNKQVYKRMNKCKKVCFNLQHVIIIIWIIEGKLNDTLVKESKNMSILYVIGYA